MPSWETLCPGCFDEKGTVTICPQCGYNESREGNALVLPYRVLLNGRYLVGRVLGKRGGFGVTYLCLDVAAKNKTCMAVKEFMPHSLVGRDKDGTSVTPYTEEDEELFHHGLKNFLQEAHILAKFDHANIVQVRAYFEGNGTAYLVMEYYHGATLAEYMLKKGPTLPQKSAIKIMLPILDGLHAVHQTGLLHRDIKPHNIYLTRDRRAILLDFGAARYAVGERSQSLSIVLTPGFAPYEQYQSRGQQGVWTDVYACGATLYYMLTGKIPPVALDRKNLDELEPPLTLAPDISPALNNALLQALAIRPNDRPQSIRAFQDLLMTDLATTATKPQSEQLSACPKCQTQNQKTNKFCFNCGTALQPTVPLPPPRAIAATQERGCALTALRLGAGVVLGIAIALSVLL